MRNKYNISEIAYEISYDEVKIKEKYEYNYHTKKFIGFCGTRSEMSDHHECDVNLDIDATTVEEILDLPKLYKIGNTILLFKINPISKYIKNSNEELHINSINLAKYLICDSFRGI